MKSWFANNGQEVIRITEILTPADLLGAIGKRPINPGSRSILRVKWDAERPRRIEAVYDWLKVAAVEIEDDGRSDQRYRNFTEGV